MVHIWVFTKFQVTSGDFKSNFKMYVKRVIDTQSTLIRSSAGILKERRAMGSNLQYSERKNEHERKLLNLREAQPPNLG